MAGISLRLTVDPNTPHDYGIFSDGYRGWLYYPRAVVELCNDSAQAVSVAYDLYVLDTLEFRLFDGRGRLIETEPERVLFSGAVKPRPRLLRLAPKKQITRRINLFGTARERSETVRPGTYSVSLCAKVNGIDLASNHEVFEVLDARVGLRN